MSWMTSDFASRSYKAMDRAPASKTRLPIPAIRGYIPSGGVPARRIEYSLRASRILTLRATRSFAAFFSVMSAKYTRILDGFPPSPGRIGRTIIVGRSSSRIGVPSSRKNFHLESRAFMPRKSRAGS
jgi:hypothetical protein